MTDVLTLPLGGGIDAPEVTDGARPPTTLQEAKRAVHAAVAAALRPPQAAEGAPAALARLVAQHGSDVVAAADWLADRMAARGAESGTGGWPRLLYEAAGAALEDGRTGEAVTLLCALAAEPGGQADAWLGLAVCAARLACHEDALVLALESRGLRPGHPRASCIAGLCELERGNRRAAQAYLASAARLARGRQEFSDDLRQAQRTLLLMHLA